MGSNAAVDLDFVTATERRCVHNKPDSIRDGRSQRCFPPTSHPSSVLSFVSTSSLLVLAPSAVPMATTPSPALSAGQMPQMPQAARPKEDGHAPPRSSEDSERRRLLHNSWQTVVAVPSIQERPSQEMSPSPQQAGSWPGTSNALVPEATDMARLPSQDSRPPSRPPGPGQYGRSTSNDCVFLRQRSRREPS